MADLIGPLAKLAFGGSLAGGDEWTCSLMLAGPAAGSAAPANGDGFRAPLGDWFLRPTSFINTGATLEYLKFNLIDKVTGKYAEVTPFTSLFTPLKTSPGTSAQAVPNQNTQCVTLHTELARGRGSRGRFYPPTTFIDGAQVDWIADGLMTASKTKGMADSAQELISEINAAALDFKVVVWSALAQSAHAVERVAVGCVVDTQRRRRSSLSENYQFATANV